MSNYLIDGNTISKSNPSFNDVLITAYKKKQRPTCLCKAPGIPMYIAKLGDHHVIKRMPNTGQHHHPDCDSFELASELSGRGEVNKKAIAEDSETGITKLNIDFSLSKKSSTTTGTKTEGKEQNSITSNPTKLTIRSVLHCLYEDAGLNKWSPRMMGKRNWFIIRKHLLDAAQNKVAKNNNLIDSLYIPETFNIEHKDAITSRRRQFLSRLKYNKCKQPLGILIGEIKKFEPTRFGHKIIVKHMPDMPLYMEEDVYRRILKHFSTELSIYNEYEDSHLITICTFYLSASGNPQIDTISLMCTDENWLPFDTIEEKDLINRLVNDNRFFVRGLRYNLASSDVIASVLLTDIKDNPTALYMIPIEAEQSYYDALSTVINDSELNHCIWNLNEEDTFSIPT